ncbi:hypothetical protein [Methylobacterium phyllostachyos]|uniref:hypothetical protein n=1 Tax=Methylobacterium phyllostachyos TaxID=582672 RepID=UPI00115F82F7|nr:hypothetical protein [Methylobacterium phyllostachyos]
MIVLLTVAIGTGIISAIILIPYGALLALTLSPLAASLSAALAGFLLAWRATRYDRSQRSLESQTGLMVAALRNAVRRRESPSPAPRVRQRRHGA